MKLEQLFPVYKPDFRYSMSDTFFCLSESSTTHFTIERNHSRVIKMRPSYTSHYTLYVYPHSLFFVATSGFSPRYYYTKTANWCCTFGICRPTAIWTRPDVVLFQVIFTYIRTRWPCETEMSSLVCSGKKLNWYLMANWSVELKPSEVISAYTISVIMFIQLFLY
jgi:hypothetical protein